MKYIIEIFANGEPIQTFVSNKDYKYKECDRFMDKFVKENIPNGKIISERMSMGDSYKIYFDEIGYKSICIHIKKRTHLDLKDSLGNPLVLNQQYEGHQPNDKEKTYRYEICHYSFGKEFFYIRNLHRCNSYYDWTSGKPKLVEPIKDFNFKLEDENIQETINEYGFIPTFK